MKKMLKKNFSKDSKTFQGTNRNGSGGRQSLTNDPSPENKRFVTIQQVIVNGLNNPINVFTGLPPPSNKQKTRLSSWLSSKKKLFSMGICNCIVSQGKKWPRARGKASQSPKQSKLFRFLWLHKLLQKKEKEIQMFEVYGYCSYHF